MKRLAVAEATSSVSTSSDTNNTQAGVSACCILQPPPSLDEVAQFIREAHRNTLTTWLSQCDEALISRLYQKMRFPFMDSLPNDTVKHSLNYLSLRSVTCAGLTCKRMQRLSKECKLGYLRFYGKVEENLGTLCHRTESVDIDRQWQLHCFSQYDWPLLTQFGLSNYLGVEVAGLSVLLRLPVLKRLKFWHDPRVKPAYPFQVYGSILKELARRSVIVNKLVPRTCEICNEMSYTQACWHDDKCTQRISCITSRPKFRHRYTHVCHLCAADHCELIKL